MKPIRLDEVARSIGTVPPDDLAAQIVVSRVSTDSRGTQPGDLFWALVGERFDGHDFVPDAIAAGAVAAVVADEYVGTEPTLGVRDTRHALGQLAGWYRRQMNATIVGVTGSVGKTSTRAAIHAVLGAAAAGCSSPRNYNNDVGVPLSLLELEPAHEFGVVELGASRSGEIRRLCEIAAPSMGVVTAVGQAHLEGFGSPAGAALAKAELVESLGTDGTAILNADDSLVRIIGESAECHVVWYGLSATGPAKLARATDVRCDESGTRFRLVGGPEVYLPAHGRHQVYAALAAVAVGRQWGIPDSRIAAALAAFEPPPMRCEVHELGSVVAINDAYNANPESMRAAIDLVCDWPGKPRRVVVCGDMKELGPASPELHRELGRDIARRGVIERLIAVGPLSRETAAAALKAGMTADAVTHCECLVEAGQVLRRAVRAGDLVLFKASRGVRLETLLPVLTAVVEAWGVATADADCRCRAGAA